MSETSIPLIRPTSVLHYWLQLAQEPSYDYIRLLDYLHECDLGFLEIALSDKNLRKLYIEPLKRYYSTHEITIGKLKNSRSHLDRIFYRELYYYIPKLIISGEGFGDLEYYSFDKLIFCGLLELTCYHITPEICSMLGMYSISLQYLKIIADTDSITDTCIHAICALCWSLKHIEIIAPEDEFCTTLSHTSLSSITYYCHELEVLILRKWVEYDGHPDKYDFLPDLSTLRMIDIDMCGYGPCVSNEALESNNRLETVKLATGTLFHDPIMRGLGEHCHLLKHVTLSSCEWYEFTDEGIVAMVQGCPLLETIEFNGWEAAGSEEYDDDEELQHIVSVTNASMYAIAQYCPNLVSFKISSIDTLAYDCNGLDAIVRSCQHLQSIHKDGQVYYTAPTPIPADSAAEDTAQSNESDAGTPLDQEQPHVPADEEAVEVGVVVATAGGGLVSRCLMLANEVASVVCTYTVGYLYDMVLKSGRNDS